MPQGDAPPRRGLRRFLTILGLLLLAVLAAAILFREALATRAAVAYLEDRGIAVQDLTVTGLTPAGIKARDIVLGDDREAAAERLAVELSWQGLWPAVERADITGLRLSLDITGDGPLLGSLQPVLDQIISADGDTAEGPDPTADPAPAPRPVPAVTFQDARIVFATPSGPMTADLAGALDPAEDGGLRADALLNLDSDLGGFHARLEGHRDPQGVLRVSADLTKGRLTWKGFAVNSFSGQLSADNIGGTAPHLTAAFDLGDLGYTPRDGAPLALSRGRLRIAGDPGLAEVTLTLEGAGEYLTLAATANAPPATAQPRNVSLNLQGEARSAGGLAQLVTLPGPQVTAGNLVVQAEGSTALADGDALPATLEALLIEVLQGRTELTGDATLAEVALADGTEGISAHLPLVARRAEDRVVLTLSQDAYARVERPARDSLRALGVPDDLQPLLASGLNLTLAAAGDRPFRLATAAAWPPREVEIALSGRANSDQGLTFAAQITGSARLGEAFDVTDFSGRLDGRASAKRLSLGGREARDVRLTLPLTADYGADGLRLAAADPGALDIGQFGAGAPLSLEAPLNFAINGLTLETAPGAAGYDYSLSGQEDGATFTISAAEAAPIAITAGALSFRFDGRFDPQSGHRADFTAKLGGLDLPGYGFSADSVEVGVALDRALRPATSRFTVKAIHLGGEEPVAAPLALSGTLKRKGAGYDVAGELALSDGAALADITGRYEDNGQARVEAASKLLSFAPDGLQPAQISPLLANFEKVRGNVTAKASLAWPRDPTAEQGQLSINGLSFSGPAEAEGLDLSVKLISLLPPTTAPGQRLTLRRLEAGVPVEDIAVDFSIESPPRLRIADGGFDLGGARWHLEPALLDPAAAENRIVLGTEALDLATFFHLIEVEGLSGKGTLKGRVPIVFAGRDVIVEDGRFEAQGPGRLSIRFETLRSALAGGGETVELAIQALEDFHYENLSVTLDKTADNDATVRLSTLGQNPDVLEGQPFQFNINLESNLTSVLKALQQGYSLSDDALRRAWQLSD